MWWTKVIGIWLVTWGSVIRGLDLAPQNAKQVPCDKTRKVFTDSWGIITDGPMGSNYTQDSHCEWLIKGKSLSLSLSPLSASFDKLFLSTSQPTTARDSSL